MILLFSLVPLLDTVGLGIRAEGYPVSYAGYVFTKALGIGLGVAGGVMMNATEPKSADWELALSGLIVGSVLYLAAAPIFVPLMDMEAENMTREGCLRIHFEKQLRSQSQNSRNEAPSFSVAPLIMPTHEGHTLYGLSGGLRF